MSKHGHWFIADSSAWTNDEVVLDADESRHAIQVLRVAPPDVITVTDGEGRVARCAVKDASERRVVAEVLAVDDHRRPKPDIAVYQGAARGAKLEDVAERLGQLGAAEFSVFESARSIVDWDESKIQKNTSRWRARARAAAKQSRSAHVMTIHGWLRWEQLLEKIASEDFSVVLWEEASLPLRSVLVGQTDRLALVVGPEGGLSREEAEALADAGGLLASLGPRILRTEDAPVVASAALLYHFGVIG
ncbi:MAG: 16S rRNA (uracil(1498)-N(3))-methyltransferase [Actinomycetota bacterium]|nr:16S rRNA (uracil(1498)-N(3))-methyltransferase [Actinomycetota bacterium]